MATGAKAQEAYAVYNDASKVVTFYYDNQKASRENTVNINNSFVFSHPYTKTDDENELPIATEEWPEEVPQPW